MEERIIGSVTLDPGRHLSPGRTRHLRGGADVSALVVALNLVKYEGDSGVYLMYLDGSGELLNDTYHETVNRAMKQAQFEFGIQEGEWKVSAG